MNVKMAIFICAQFLNLLETERRILYKKSLDFVLIFQVVEYGFNKKHKTLVPCSTE